LCPIFLFKGEADYHVPEQAVVKLSDCMVDDAVSSELLSVLESSTG
jgi:hypothetical protein